jgi:SAM-dependent methyltransferase
MRDFYERFYRVAPASAVHSEFCERVFGADLCQHGSADVAQLDLVVSALGIAPGARVLDLGCGNGMISEYLSDRTGAKVLGVDDVPFAVEQALDRTTARRDRLVFVTEDLNALDLPAGELEAVVSIDTLHLADDLGDVVDRLRTALARGGRMVALYSYGWRPLAPREGFDALSLAPERTPLGRALVANGLPFTTRDLTVVDLQMARLREEVLTELAPRFEAEGLGFVLENRLGDARVVQAAIEAGLHRRYLYRVRVP